MDNSAVHDQSICTTNLPAIAKKHIVIAGGGISGLAFPLALSKQWPPSLPASSLPRITVYERDDAESRVHRQGYSMSVRCDGDRGGGIQVLDDIGLYEQAYASAVLTDSFNGTGATADSPSFCIWEPSGVDAHDCWKTVLQVDGRIMGNHTKRKLGSMRIRRNALQKLLMDAVHLLPNVEFKFGKIITSSELRAENQKETINVMFADGTITECDILIDATGSASKIRSHLRPELSPPSGLDFAETIMISGTAKFATKSEIPAEVQRHWGLLQGYTGIGCFLSPVDETSTLWSVSYRSKTQRDRLRQPLSEESTRAILDEAKSLGKHGGAKLRTLIEATDPSTLMTINCCDRPPFSHDLVKHGSVIHIGDANHAVSPWAGNGANMALIDGWDLAKAMIEHDDLPTAIEQFEKRMINRCKAVLTDSRNNMEFAHVTGLSAWAEWVKMRALGWLMWGMMLFWK